MVERLGVEPGQAMCRVEAERVADRAGVERAQLRLGPWAFGARVGGEPLGQRVGRGAQLAEPARAEVDRVEDQDVARDVRRRALEEVQLLVEPGDAAEFDLGGGSIRTWRADAATAAQWRRTSSVSTPGQATVMGRMRRLSSLLAVLAVGCGNDIADGPSPAPDPSTVALDFTPNAVHAPLYMAGTG